MSAKSWIGDDLPDEPYDHWLDRGETYQTGEDAPVPRPVKRQIGFIRRKPVVRVKAWTRPIW